VVTDTPLRISSHISSRINRLIPARRDSQAHNSSNHHSIRMPPLADLAARRTPLAEWHRACRIQAGLISDRDPVAKAPFHRAAVGPGRTGNSPSTS